MRAALCILGSVLLAQVAIAAPAAEAPLPVPGEAPARAAARPLVRRGDRVILSARVGRVVASVPAEALEDGQTGDTIRVRNLQSARMQVGRVTRAGEVEVVP